MNTSENQVTRAFRIHDQNLAQFEDAMNRLARRAKRLGCEPVAFAKGDAEDVPEMITRDGRKVPTGFVFRYWPVTVSGKAPKFNGWTFAATMQHVATDDGSQQTLLRSVPGSTVAIPETYRTVGPNCAHCNQNRRRADTYLLAHDSGKLIQVGSTCLRDFLGHDSPEHLAEMAEWLRDACEAGEEGEEYGGGGSSGGRGHYTVLHFLGYVSAAMREHGWTPRSKAMPEFGKPSTADIAYSSMLHPRDPKSLAPVSSDEERAALALEWARTLNERNETGADYLYNVNVVARCTVLGNRSTGLAASIISAYERAMGQEAERKLARAASGHVGTVDARMVVTLTIVTIRELDGNYGVTRMHNMVDAAGNRFKWFGSGAGAEIGKEGETVTIKATVKKHDEYKGIKETVLSRCAVHVEKVKAPRKVRAAKVAEPVSDNFVSGDANGFDNFGKGDRDF